MSEKRLKGTPVPTEEREKHKAMLEEPKRWPLWPILPLKRYFLDEEYGERRVEAGFFVSADFPTVVMSKPFTMSGILRQLSVEDNHKEGDEWPEWYAEEVVHRYDSIDEMLGDGWVVD